MTDVSAPRNPLGEGDLTFWRRVGITGFVVGQIAEVIYFGVWARQTADDVTSASSPWPVVFALMAASLVFGLGGIYARHVRDKYYRHVPSGTITGFDTDSYGHPYIWLSGLNRMGQFRQQRVYIRNPMKWRELKAGDSYTQ